MPLKRGHPRRDIGTKAPLGHQEEGYASHLDCQDVTQQAGRYGSRFFRCAKRGKNLIPEQFSSEEEKCYGPIATRRGRHASANVARLFCLSCTFLSPCLSPLALLQQL